MKLFQSESDRYTQEQLTAREAQRLAEYIAWGYPFSLVLVLVMPTCTP